MEGVASCLKWLCKLIGAWLNFCSPQEIITCPVTLRALQYPPHLQVLVRPSSACLWCCRGCPVPWLRLLSLHFMTLLLLCSASILSDILSTPALVVSAAMVMCFAPPHAATDKGLKQGGCWGCLQDCKSHSGCYLGAILSTCQLYLDLYYLVKLILNFISAVSLLFGGLQTGD